MEAQKIEAIQPPLLIGGESPTETEFSIDYLSFTVPVAFLRSITGNPLRSDFSESEYFEYFWPVAAFLFGEGLELKEEMKNGRNFFNHHFDFVVPGSFITWGGNNSVTKGDGTTAMREPRVQFNLSGSACALVENWENVYKFLRKGAELGFDVRITRCDVAADFHQGQYTVDDALEWYKSGEFTGRGRPPSPKYIDDLGTGKGRTFYVGARENGKQFRAYEKGKQLGDTESPWVRFETEFHNTDRVIPLEILLDPRGYLSGSYKCLSFLSECIEVIKTAVLKAEITYSTAKFWCRRQFGKLLNYAHNELGVAMENIYYEFSNPDGYPERLKAMARG